MSLTVTSYFWSQMKSTNPSSMVTKFTFNETDISDRVVKYRTVSRDISKIVGGNFTIELENASQTFNSLVVDKTQFFKDGIFEFGYYQDGWGTKTDPSSLPTGLGNSVAFSQNNSYLAVAHYSSPYISVYNTSDWSKISDPSSLPTGNGWGVAFSQNNLYMAVGHVNTPFISIYNVSDWSKLTDPSSLPTSAVMGVAFSQNNSYMAVALYDSPFISIYNVSDWSKISDPSSLPPNIGTDVEFSPNNSYMAVTHYSSPFISIYNVSDWSKLTDPSSLPTGNAAGGVAFSPNNSYMAVAHTGAPCVTIYNVSDWSKRTDFIPDVSILAHGVDFSQDNLYMGVAHYYSPFISIYNTSDWSKISDPSPLPTGRGYDFTFSPNNSYMAVAHLTSPYLTIYDTPITPYLIQLFGGDLQKATLNETKVSLTFRDRMLKLKKYKVGSAEVPVSFTNTSVNPADLAWWMVTSYGGLSTLKSTANPDISYSAWLDWWTIFNDNTTLVQANFTGIEITEVLEIIAEVTDSSIYAEGDNKLYFQRWTGQADDTITVTDSFMTGKVNINIDSTNIINSAKVLLGYNVDSESWAGEYTEQNTTSIGSFGTFEAVYDDNSIWMVDSASAKNLAERIVFRKREPNVKVQIPTPLTFVNVQLGDQIFLTSQVYSFSERIFSLLNYSIDVEKGTMVLGADEGFGKGIGRIGQLEGFKLDDAYWGLMDETYNPIY